MRRLTLFQSGVLSDRWHWLAIVVFMVAAGWGQPAWALITGGEGNEPLHDPGWPKGAAAVFNVKSRVAYWEGPPFGGDHPLRSTASRFNQTKFIAVPTP